jgi:hypothetical protein
VRRSLGPLEKTRAFGMTPLERTMQIKYALDVIGERLMQTKLALPDRMAIRLRVTMRVILPFSCNLLRSWIVLPSGL